ncbi:MAG: single-stranded DNA-binding protein, partial [Bacteroidota bacterium]|nr:single-stranded DNA-binding protein [Bacteroidota bacterium]
YVEGRIKTRKWQGEDGQDRYTTEVNVDEFTFLSTKRDSTSNDDMKTESSEESQQVDEKEDDLPF